MTLPVSPSSLPRVRAMLDGQLRLARRDKHLRLVAQGPLEGREEDLSAAFDELVERRAELVSIFYGCRFAAAGAHVELVAVPRGREREEDERAHHRAGSGMTC